MGVLSSVNVSKKLENGSITVKGSSKRKSQREDSSNLQQTFASQLPWSPLNGTPNGNLSSPINGTLSSPINGNPSGNLSGNPSGIPSGIPKGNPSGTHFNQITRLDLSGTVNDPSILMPITESSSLCNLSFLNLKSCHLQPPHVQLILDSDHLLKLEVLGLSENNLGKSYRFPGSSKHGLSHNLKVIDLRENEGITLSSFKSNQLV